MSARRYYWLFGIILVLSFISLPLTFYTVNPSEAGLILKILIYLNVFFFSLAVFFLFFIFLRRRFLPEGLVFEQTHNSLRQAIFISGFLTLLLFFSSKKLLIPAVILPSLFIFLIPEIYLYYKIIKNKRNGN